MKTTTILTAFILLSFAGMAQTKVTKDATGNYVTVKRSDTTANKSTGHTITTADGKTYPVYISERGKLYFDRISKAGKKYKSYIKED